MNLVKKIKCKLYRRENSCLLSYYIVGEKQYVNSSMSEFIVFIKQFRRVSEVHIQ